MPRSRVPKSERGRRRRNRRVPEEYLRDENVSGSDYQAAEYRDAHENTFSEEALGDEFYDTVAHKRQGPFARVVNHWVDRLEGAAAQRSLSDQEALYDAGRPKRDYIFNSAGAVAWGIVFPLLTIVATQLVGVEQAGVFSLAFVTGSLLMIVGNYGVRTYQVSDVSEQHSCADYQVNRILTCLVMIIAGFAYCKIRGYEDAMFTISMGVYVYRMVDALADVYEGRLQQADKMYLGGLSQALRSLLVFAVFAISLFIGRNLAFSCVLMAATAIATLVVVTIPLAFMETPKSARVNLGGVASLFKLCSPLFVALFLYAFIDNMPKFLMEGTLSYDNQLYFNVLYFPAQGILMTVGMIYKPLLVRLANAWDDSSRRDEFGKTLTIVFVVIVAVTVVVLVVMGWIGVPVMSVLYGLDFEPYRLMMYLMIVAGGITAAIDFLYQVITVQRRQNSVMKLYAITFAFSIVVTLVLVHTIGLLGAVIAYLAEMLFLLILIIIQFANIRVRRG